MSIDLKRRELCLGFDVDGVLALFEREFERRCERVTGKNLFPWTPGSGEADPPCWDWPQHFGYTPEEVSAVWQDIKTDDGFWASLDPSAGADDLWVMGPAMEAEHRIYFITSRVGNKAKQQTERWLQQHCGFKQPTVLISSAKGMAAVALKLDAYIDDNADNVNDVMARARENRLDTAVYLLDRAYNREGVAGPIDVRVRRISKVRYFLEAYGIQP